MVCVCSIVQPDYCFSTGTYQLVPAPKRVWYTFNKPVVAASQFTLGTFRHQFTFRHQSTQKLACNDDKSKSMLFWCLFEHYNQHLTFLRADVTTGLLKVYQTLFGASAYNKPLCCNGGLTMSLWAAVRHNLNTNGSYLHIRKRYGLKNEVMCCVNPYNILCDAEL